MKLLFGLISLFFFSTITWQGDFKSAEDQAAKENKFVLVNFSGSDWCIPCMRLRKEILESAVFENYAKDHLVLVRADFPRQKKNQLEAAQVKRNEALADKYNSEGSFPLTLLIDKNGKVVKKWDGMPNESADQFVAEIADITNAGH